MKIQCQFFQSYSFTIWYLLCQLGVNLGFRGGPYTPPPPPKMVVAFLHLCIEKNTMAS